ncbi:hypothetical protein GCM10010231_57640 [Streptomyces sindenensis]|nr:hypothetical protein GCM10010231_57640 [Streptomyces sindenensis]
MRGVRASRVRGDGGDDRSGGEGDGGEYASLLHAPFNGRNPAKGTPRFLAASPYRLIASDSAWAPVALCSLPVLGAVAAWCAGWRQGLAHVTRCACSVHNSPTYE